MPKTVNFNLEQELRFRIPKSAFVTVLNAKDFAPITKTKAEVITQYWTYNDGVARSRIRTIRRTYAKTIGLPEETVYTACTKYRLTDTEQIEFEQPITKAEYETVLSLYPKAEPVSKLRIYFYTKENPGIEFSADIYANYDDVIIEVETPQDAPVDRRIVIPSWIANNAVIGVTGKQVQ